MNGPIDALTLQFLAWLNIQPRTYAEAMEAWRTSCPRLTVWEDSLHAGLIERAGEAGTVRIVLTLRGREALASARAGENATGGARREL